MEVIPWGLALFCHLAQGAEDSHCLNVSGPLRSKREETTGRSYK